MYANSSQNRHGFTLIELIVVISIIALLIALLLPALARAKGLANTIACASNEQQIALATIMWSHEHRGFAPGSALAGGLEDGSPNTAGIGQYLWGTFTWNGHGMTGTPQSPDTSFDFTGWPWALFVNRGQSILVTRGYVSTPTVFICPTSNLWAPSLMSSQLTWLPDSFGYVDYRFNLSIVGDATPSSKSIVWLGLAATSIRGHSYGTDGLFGIGPHALLYG